MTADPDDGVPETADRVGRRGAPGLRWRLADDAPAALFADETAAGRHVGTGAYQGMEFLQVNARTIINPVPAGSRMPFRYTINAYRGCSHACTYCLWGETPVLMADARTRRLADIRPGDRVIGTVADGPGRRCTVTTVLDHWSTVKPAYRVRLSDATELIASADHRFLTATGWRHVRRCGDGGHRPHLGAGDRLVGTGLVGSGPTRNAEYLAGYRYGLRQEAPPPGTGTGRSASAGGGEDGVDEGGFEGHVRTLRRTAGSPPGDSDEWCTGLLAGAFDAGGTCDDGELRLAGADPAFLVRLATALSRFGFDLVTEFPHPGGRTGRTGRPGRPGLVSGATPRVRIGGGLAEHLRFLHTVGPSAAHRARLEGSALPTEGGPVVLEVAPLGMELPLHDVTTGTGDFIAGGVVSHNCFARPTHEYLGLDMGRDFERRIVVKVNAVDRLRAELRAPTWEGDPIAMGTNTDPYQAAEGKYHLTRGIIEVLGAAGNPFSILTKSTLVLRDLPLLVRAARRGPVRVDFSIGTLDRAVWRLTEPGTPPPDRRVAAVARLREAGIDCGVLVAPVLPGLSDSPEQVRAVVEACLDAGALSVTAVGLHLRPGVRQHYLGFLAERRPDLLALHEQRFGHRSYQPKAEQARLSALVAQVAAEHRARSGRPEPPARSTLPRLPRRGGAAEPLDAARRRHPAGAGRRPPGTGPDPAGAEAGTPPPETPPPGTPPPGTGPSEQLRLL